MARQESAGGSREAAREDERRARTLRGRQGYAEREAKREWEVAGAAGFLERGCALGRERGPHGARPRR